MVDDLTRQWVESEVDARAAGFERVLPVGSLCPPVASIEVGFVEACVWVVVCRVSRASVLTRFILWHFLEEMRSTCMLGAR